MPKNSRFAAPADMAKLADAPDLGSGAARRVGSTPIIRTKGQSECGFECEGGKYPHTQTQTHCVLRVCAKRLLAMVFFRQLSIDC